MYAGGRRREVHSSRYPKLLQFSGLRHPRPIRPLCPRGLDQELESSSLSQTRTLSRGQNPAIVKHMSCERVRLDFDTPEERRFFSDSFLVARREYTEVLAEFEKYKRQLKHAGDRPKGPSHGVYGMPASSVASMSGAASGLHRPVSSASTAPRIAPVAAFSRLSLGGIGEEK